EAVVSQAVSVTAAPADPAQYASAPPELASLPPVLDPFGHDAGSPNPSQAQYDPNDAPKHDVGSAASLGRSDCDATWQAARSQRSGWSLCFPASWTYRQNRIGVAGTWEDSFSLDRRGTAATA